MEECVQAGICFIMHWPKNYQLHDWRMMKQKAWQMSRGKRNQWKRMRLLWQAQALVRRGIVVVPVTHPQVAGQFWFMLTDAQTGEYTARGQTILAHTPMARLGEASDLVGALLWLVSPAASFVTSIVVPVDGGCSAFSGV